MNLNDFLMNGWSPSKDIRGVTIQRINYKRCNKDFFVKREKGQQQIKY